MSRALTIVNVGYSSTNYWVVSAGVSRLLLDLGYPGTMATMRANLKRMDVPLGELRYALATHYHIDHAGLAQDLKNAGVPLLVPEIQSEFIPLMKRHVKPNDGFTDIALHDNVVIPLEESRALLESIGIAGEIVHTPGHSDDSVTLLLDGGEAFVGDLTAGMFLEGDADLATESWRMLRDRGATTIYPGHGPIYPISRVPV